MKFTGLNQLRKSFLDFFESKGHLRLESASLVPPQGDNSILLINAGMTPLKKYFQGIETPPRNRAASCQKCIRTPDIDNVGITARHGTFFEMLGNFSFGDYFKEDACKWAWEYFTEVLKIPADLLWISVYEEDDEAMSIWVNKVGVPKERVKKFGKSDNFWEHGSGPCGPCSEIYFDRGEQHGCGSDSCVVGCDCDRYIEVWNLVFTQFDSDGKGNYAPLANKNIDTGMGLERLACVMQGANNLFEVDTIKSVIEEIQLVSGVKYVGIAGKEVKSDISIRVITDHVRASSFLIADGVLPSNEGRGYVLRRLLRRAARHGKLLGILEPFLHALCDTVIATSADAYPELIERKTHIKNVIKAEEDRFGATIDAGMRILLEYIEQINHDKLDKRLAGADCFKLYDTFGFPIDLTVEILAEHGMTADLDGFDILMSEQRERARAASATFSAKSWETIELGLPKDEPTVFVGYDVVGVSDAVLLAAGDAWCVLDKTPFYAEKGGQISDIGVIRLVAGDAFIHIFTVESVRETPDSKYLHIGYWESDAPEIGAIVAAEVDAQTRMAVMRAHSTTHLLHAALRAVVGEHIEQAGSWVGHDTFANNGA